MTLLARTEAEQGSTILHDPRRNKGTAFTEHERDQLGLRGLLPPRVFTLAQQESRALENLRRKTSDLEKYVFLTSLQDRNETLFYRLVINHLEEIVPLIYTPTVGLACQSYAHIFRRPMGMYLSSADRGHIHEVLQNWPGDDVRVIVVTDGERILGLGDLGADGMGIPVGKLALYVACAGIHPSFCLPVMLDVGTDNDALLADSLYIGSNQRRMRGPEYDALVDEFVAAAQTRWPGVLIQLEDFGNANAFRLLRRYKNQACLFDDDIQGTASVALAGLYSALRITGGALTQQRFLFFGAGEAGIGIGNLIVSALEAEGLTTVQARERCWFVDSGGLVTHARTGLAEHKLPFAHPHAPVTDLAGAVDTLQPTVLIGVSGVPQTFTQPIIEAMGRYNARPVIFALSNPTSKSECTAEQAYQWTDGRAVFASGSPFAPVEINRTTLVSGQGNNAYIFPGVGLGVVVSGATRVTDEMFLVAAKVLAECTGADDLAVGRIYPALSRIREVSAAIATAIVTLAHARGLARYPAHADVAAQVRAHMYEPLYAQFDQPTTTH